jgi:hypothetical protein
VKPNHSMSNGAVEATPHEGDLIRRLLRVPVRHWFCTLLLVGVSVLSAVVAVERFSQPHWRLEGSLLYTPVPLTDVQRGVYTSPSLPSFLSLLKSPANLNQLRDEFQLDVPVSALSRQFSVQQQEGAEATVLALNWHDGAEGSAMVNRLMELFNAQVVQLRQQRLAECVPNLERNLQLCKERLARSQARCTNLLSSVSGSISRTELELVSREILALETTHLEAIRTAVNLEARIQQQEKTGPQGDDPAKKQERARDLVKLERVRQEVLSSLALKQKELRAVTPLAAQGYVPRLEMEKTRQEIETLNVQLREAEELVKLVNQPETSALLTVSTSARGAVTMPDLEGHLVGVRREIVNIEEKLNTRKQQAKGLKEMLRQAEPCFQEMETINTERQQLEGQLAAARQIQAVDLNDFRIVSRAAPTPDRVTSNWKKVAGAGFAGSLLLGLGLLTLGAVANRSWRLDTLTSRLALPVLARLGIGRGQRHHEADVVQLRGLALRLRQHVPEQGGTVLISPLQEGRPSESLICDLGRCLALRDEKVLILDARLETDTDRAVQLPDRLKATAGVGLAHLLRREVRTPQECICRTRLANVDLLPAGGPEVQTDLLATNAMARLLTDLRDRYTVILVLGPALSRTVETEILAAYAQGIVVLLNGSIPRFDSAVPDLVQSLREVKAPLLGVVTVG